MIDSFTQFKKLIKEKKSIINIEEDLTVLVIYTRYFSVATTLF